MRNFVSLRLNQDSIKKKIDMAIANSSQIRAMAMTKAFGIFSRLKRSMLKEFDRHPITMEIDAGPSAENITNTLGGYGNLFSFIGFEAGDNPTERLREILEIGTTLQQTIYRQGVWYFRVHLPDRASIEQASQMPWEPGNSWAYAVERYISGLSFYLYKAWAGSRSGAGIQLPYEYLEDATFSGQPYITEILQHFREKVGQS